MPQTDMPLEQLRSYRPEIAEPPGFDDFWAETLGEAREAAGTAPPARFPRVTDSPLRTVDVYDVRFPGWAGQPVAAWLLLPRDAAAPLPVVVNYIGYSGGRGLHTDNLLWSAAGYAHLVVDSRGQGHATPDPDPAPGPQYVGGFMTRGIDGPRHHYYRRLITDAVRAVDAVRAHPAVDPERVVVTGHSQGGGMALAAAALTGDHVAAALVDVPFLCHIRRGVELATAGPYPEIAHYLGVHVRDDPESVFATLAHFDGLHFARRAASVPALFSVALMDPVCPPSSGFAAYNHYAHADKDVAVWQFGDHGGGRGSQTHRQLDWLAAHGLGPDDDGTRDS
ncbi:acetylxylan esterase [Streptomyces nanshensis]|uniref:Acetyl xylan esterase n=1 Tax=Streptomyces nanshensis TaxID=518642 RepID=A0A1E7L997_9ACTN|nr:alpha/beta fold hydrolase [Streptomyces nanshensis]OEV12734.1 acetyl xylan esterase [Streptomyces nanshensis]